jgi:hypothetical protein
VMGEEEAHHSGGSTVVGGRSAGNGGARPVVGSRWSENWSTISGVLGQSC